MHLKFVDSYLIRSFASAKMEKKLFLILHNIRSAYNVGAIFRTADGAGVSKIFLTGYSSEKLNILKQDLNVS